MTESTAAGGASEAGLAERLQPHKRWLVEQGDALGGQARNHGKWKSQIRTLLEAARHETEPRVLLNLLGYQATREKKWKDNDLEKSLRVKLAECDDRAAGDAELAMEMIRHLLLYFVRAYTYEADRAEAGKGAADASNQQKGSSGGAAQ